MDTIFVICNIITFLLAVLAFIDFSYRNFKKQNVPFYWLLFIFFLPLIGTFLYLFVKPWEKANSYV